MIEKTLVNRIPGRLVYKGMKKQGMRLDHYAYNSHTVTKRSYNGLGKEFEKALSNLSKDHTHWINVIGLSDLQAIEILGQRLGIDLLLLEQIVTISKQTTYQVADDYIFADMQMLYPVKGRLHRENLSIFAKENLLVTFQEVKDDVFDNLRQRLDQNEGYVRQKESSYLLFSLLDAVVDYYGYALEDIKGQLEKIEMDLVEDESLDSRVLHDLRKQLMMVAYSGSPVGEFLRVLVQKEETQMQSNIKFYQSLENHMDSINDEATNLKDFIGGLYENYMLLNGDRMNRIMTTLTIFSAIFIPLSFLAGVFGMNFDSLPGSGMPGAFGYFVMGCFLTAGLMLSYFKYKKWF